MSTKNIAIERAVVLLNAAGVHYKIVAPDGQEFGDLETKPVGSYKKTGIKYKSIYHEKMAAMNVGDVAEFKPVDGMPVSNLRGAIASHASASWGKGGHISSIKGDTVELLRVQ